MEDLLATEKEIEFRKPFYYRKNDPVPYCARCWEVDKKLVHLDGPYYVENIEMYDCNNCDNNLTLN